VANTLSIVDPCHRGLVDGVVHVPAAKLHFDEADARLHQTAGQKRTLAEAAVGRIWSVCRLSQAEVEGLEVFALHELHGFVVELGVSLHFLGLELFAEGIVELIHEQDALLELQSELVWADVLQAGLRIGDWNRAGGRREEASTRIGAAAVDDHAIWQGDTFDAAQEVGSPGTHAGMHDGATRLIAGFHDVGAGSCTPVLELMERTMVILSANLRHLGHGAAEVVDAALALDGICRAPWSRRLGIPGVDVGHAAVHPEEDDVLGLAEARGAGAGGCRARRLRAGMTVTPRAVLGRAHDEVTAGQGLSLLSSVS
jgi:hypothetical protein